MNRADAQLHLAREGAIRKVNRGSFYSDLRAIWLKAHANELVDAGDGSISVAAEIETDEIALPGAHTKRRFAPVSISLSRGGFLGPAIADPGCC